MLSVMSITQRSASCGCLRQETSAALRLAMGRLLSLQPTHAPVHAPMGDAISRDDRSEGEKYEFSRNILGWLNLFTNNWSSETRYKPSLP
jgi:hypothetical protein